MIKTERKFHIDASPEVVWGVMSDIERWPQWTATAESAKRGEDGPLRAGATARMKIVGASGVGLWTVTSVDDGREFVWENRTAGVRSVAGHRVEPNGAGSKVYLWIEQSGVMATLIGWYLRRVSNRNIDIEAEGLKRESERLAGTAK
jgi:carbon monoxide dehydrogenase subunit G